MNIVEALKIAKEQGKKVRPVGAEWFVKYIEDVDEHYRIWGNNHFDWLVIDNALEDWEVVKEKPSKQTQYKIDSMKFQIVRYCKSKCCSCVGCEITKMCDKCFKTYDETPRTNLLDDWSLKEIVEAYHILKEAGEI